MALVSSILSALSYLTSFLLRRASVGALSLSSEGRTCGLKGYCSMALLILSSCICFSFSLYSRVYIFFSSFLRSIECRSFTLG